MNGREKWKGKISCLYNGTLWGFGYRVFLVKDFLSLFVPSLMVSGKDELTLFMVFLLIYALKSHGNS